MKSVLIIIMLFGGGFEMTIPHSYSYKNVFNDYIEEDPPNYIIYTLHVTQYYSSYHQV